MPDQEDADVEIYDKGEGVIREEQEVEQKSNVFVLKEMSGNCLISPQVTIRFAYNCHELTIKL